MTLVQLYLSVLLFCLLSLNLKPQLVAAAALATAEVVLEGGGSRSSSDWTQLFLQYGNSRGCPRYRESVIWIFGCSRWGWKSPPSRGHKTGINPVFFIVTQPRELQTSASIQRRLLMNGYGSVMRKRKSRRMYVDLSTGRDFSSLIIC